MFKIVAGSHKNRQRDGVVVITVTFVMFALNTHTTGPLMGIGRESVREG